MSYRLVFTTHLRFSSKELAALHAGDWLPEKTETYEKAKLAMEQKKASYLDRYIIDDSQCGLKITRKGVRYSIYGAPFRSHDDCVRGKIAAFSALNVLFPQVRPLSFAAYM